METQRSTESHWNGHTISDLSDLTGIGESLLREGLAYPRMFTLDEVSELAPHLGMTPAEYVTAVLS